MLNTTKVMFKLWLRSLTYHKGLLKRSSQRDKDDVQVVVSPSQKRMLKGSSQRCNDVVQVVVEESSLPQKRRMMNGSYSRYRDYSSIINKKNTVVKSIEGFTYDLGINGTESHRFGNEVSREHRTVIDSKTEIQDG